MKIWWNQCSFFVHNFCDTIALSKFQSGSRIYSTKLCIDRYTFWLKPRRIQKRILLPIATQDLVHQLFLCTGSCAKRRRAIFYLGFVIAHWSQHQSIRCHERIQGNPKMDYSNNRRGGEPLCTSLIKKCLLYLCGKPTSTQISGSLCLDVECSVG